MSKFATFRFKNYLRSIPDPPVHTGCFGLVNSIIVYLVLIYIGFLESFLQMSVLSVYFVMFHVLCHKLFTNISILFIMAVFSFTKSMCNSPNNPFV